MKRFGVWTLIFLFATMDFGHIAPGFAQTQEDDAISDVSGQSVRYNVFWALWTWTAPTTDTVTFDTQGSDFDMLLVVSDGVAILPIATNFNSDGTFSSEVRLTAQQGQTYGIVASRADGSLDPGTIVLNWQTASSGGGIRVIGDDFSSSTTISGASGQSEGSNVGADKESGEPDHARISGGVSVWWTWLAPAPGPVTFDTRGSKFDTLLAVYTGDSLDSLVEVASNDDASSGGLQSEASFAAEQGQTYHIAIDGIGGVTGEIVLNWRLESTASPLRVAVFETPEHGKPDLVIAGDNGSLQFWKTPDGALGQSLQTSADGSEAVRIFYDAATGLPRQILNEVTGNWILVQQTGVYVDFWFYDHEGNYQSGFSVFEEDGEFYQADIVGFSVHAGKQMTGQFHSAAGSWVGNLRLDVGWGEDLANIRPVPPRVAALMKALLPPAENQQEGALSGSGRPRLAAFQESTRYAGLFRDLATFLAPRVAAAQEEDTSFPSKSKLLTFLGLFLGAGEVSQWPRGFLLLLQPA